MVRPAAVTVPPSWILSSVPIVYETAIPPPATPCQSAFDAPVGRAANSRNTEGSTPSTAVEDPLTGIRTASIRSDATTPGIRPTFAARLSGSENGATMSRSACTVRCSGATWGSAAAMTRSGRASSLALLPMASPGATGADPVDGLTAGRPNPGAAASVLPRGAGRGGLA